MNEEKRQIILKHYLEPFHKNKPTTRDYKTINTRIASCIDNLDLYVKIDDTTSQIEDMCFTGEACAIATSSMSIMIQNLLGKTVLEAQEYISNVEKMLNHEPYDQKLLKEANVYEDIYKQGHRKDCAYLPYQGLKKILKTV